MYKFLVIVLSNYLTLILYGLKDLLMADPKDAQIASLQNELNDLKSKIGKLNTSGGGSMTSGLNMIGGKLDNLSTIMSNQGSMVGKLSGLMGFAGGDKLAQFGTVLASGAKLFNTFVEQSTQSSNAIFDMYRSGITIRMDQLTSTANSFGLSVQELTPLLTKHGQTVSTMGIARTAQLGEMFRAVTRNGADFGMSMAQADESLLTYTDILKTSGRLRLMSDTEIRDGALKFADQLEAAAQATGKNVEQLAQESKARMEQTDVLWAYAHMTEDQKARMQELQNTLSEYGTAGADAFTQAVAYTTGGMAGVSQDWAIALGDRGRALLDDLANAVGEEDQKAAMLKIYDAMKANLLPEGARVAPELRGAADVQAVFLNEMEKSINATKDKTDAENRTSEAIDETAAMIGDFSSRITEASNKVYNAFNDVAVAGVLAFSDQLDVVTQLMLDYSGQFADGSRSLLDPTVREKIQTALGDMADLAPIAAALGISLSALYAAVGKAVPVAESAAVGAAGPGASAAASETMMSRFARALKGVFGGTAISTAGDIASSAGYERTGAGLSAGGDIITDSALGRLAGSFLKRSGIGAAVGAGYGVYQNWDNIKTATMGPTTAETPAANPVYPASTPGFFDMLAGDTTEPDTTQVASIIEPLNQIADSNNAKLAQDKLLMEQNVLILDELKKLNENIDDQTTALKNAYSQGYGNIYPR